MDTDFIGFAELPVGVRGQCTNTFSFTGNGAEHVDYSIKLAGKYSGPFDLQSRPGLYSWSPCIGSTAILNMNTACNITPTHLPALIAVSSSPVPKTGFNGTMLMLLRSITSAAS